MRPTLTEPATPLALGLLAERLGGGGDVVGGERRDVFALELRQVTALDARQSQRLPVQRLLEDGAGEARVAEALAALRVLEDASQGLDRCGLERVLGVRRQLLADRDELVVRVVGERDL